MARAGERFGNQRIEETGADSADDAQQNAFAGCRGRRYAFIGQGIKSNRDTDQADSAEDQHRIARRRHNIVSPAPSTSASPAPMGKATAMPATEIAATIRILPTLKMAPPQKPATGCGRSRPADSGRNYAVKKDPSAQGQSENERTHQKAQGVVEIVELKGPLPGELLCIRPGSPAEHAETSSARAQRIGLRYNMALPGRVLDESSYHGMTTNAHTGGIRRTTKELPLLLFN